MEYLLMAQPVAESFEFVIGCTILLAGAAFVVAYLIRMIEENDRLSDVNIEGLKKLQRFSGIILIVTLLISVPVSVCSNAWDIYKNVIAYRAINSETADKAIKNADLFMDKLNDVLKNWDPVKPEKESK